MGSKYEGMHLWFPLLVGGGEGGFMFRAISNSITSWNILYKVITSKKKIYYSFCIKYLYFYDFCRPPLPSQQQGYQKK